MELFHSLQTIWNEISEETVTTLTKSMQSLMMVATRSTDWRFCMYSFYCDQYCNKLNFINSINLSEIFFTQFYYQVVVKALVKVDPKWLKVAWEKFFFEKEAPFWQTPNNWSLYSFLDNIVSDNVILKIISDSENSVSLINFDISFIH